MNALRHLMNAHRANRFQLNGRHLRGKFLKPAQAVVVLSESFSLQEVGMASSRTRQWISALLFAAASTVVTSLWAGDGDRRLWHGGAGRRRRADRRSTPTALV
jgi:hypothetical protein